MKNVFNWRYTPVLQFVVAVVVCSLLASASVADEPESQSNSYAHLYYLQFTRDANRDTRYELVQHRLPFFDESDTIQAEQHKVISPNAGQILVVQDNQVLYWKRAIGITTFNTATGETATDENMEFFNHFSGITLNEHRNEIVIMPYMSESVRRYGLTDKKMEAIFQPDPSPPIPGRSNHTMALSPDGQQLALVTHSPKKRFDSLTRFRVDIVDLAAEGTPSKLLTNEAYGKFALSGSGEHIVGPPIVWKDEETVVLLVSKPPKPLNPQGDVIPFGNSHTQSQSKLVTFNITTGKESEICKAEMPEDMRIFRAFDHQLWRRADGEVILSSKDGSDSRIDFSQKKLVKDSRLSQHYEFRRSPNFVGTLLYHGAVLAEGVKATDLSIAPDGRAVVWLEAQQQNGFPNPNAERLLIFHSLTTGQLKLTTGIFRNDLGRSPLHPSENRRFIWGK
ncbi:hypothetical protein N9153_00900 [Planctomicrobium sp.]|jgi:hypothetical protein|nr:hypothetical protein [Planctomicrobium sp.]MDB4439459.1 hypothetical protein [Planctomicrobium sp.]